MSIEYTDENFKKRQRLRINGTYFNTNLNFNTVEFTNTKYKALSESILKKKVLADMKCKENKICYIDHHDTNGFYSDVPLNHKAETINEIDKQIPALALYLRDNYEENSFFVYAFKAAPQPKLARKTYYGVIGILHNVIFDNIFDSEEECIRGLLNGEIFADNINYYCLQCDDSPVDLSLLRIKENVFPILITEDFEDVDNFIDYFPVEISGGFKKNQIISILTISSLIFGLNYYVDNYQDEVHNSIINTEENYALLELEKNENYLAEFKTLEVKNGAEKRLIYEQGKSEFLSAYYSNLYSTAEIHENFETMRALFPDYLSEWKLNKIIFDSRKSLESNNIFFVVYDRIEGSIGVYDELDERVKAISEKSGIRITPKELIKVEGKGTGFKGESRVYSVDFNYDKKLELYKNSLVSMDFLAERDKKIVELSVNANQRKANIFALIEDAKALTKEQVLLGTEHLSINNTIYLETKILNKQYEEIIAMTKKPLKDIQLPKNIHFDEYKYISLKQRDSLFEWNYPTLKTVYPDQKKIKKQNFAISTKEYFFNLKSVKKLSLGYTFFLEAINKLNVDQIQIKYAEYNVGDQTYLFEGRFYEQIDLDH